MDGQSSWSLNKVLTYVWDLFSQVSFDGENRWIDLMLSGVGYTVSVFACAWILALVLGFIVGCLRVQERPIISRLCLWYVELFRNIPLLVQLFIWYFVLPELFPPLKRFSDYLSETASPDTFTFVVAVICLGFFTSARIAEQVRSGLMSLQKGQRFAAYALGMTEGQTYFYVLLPMVVRIIMPPLTSEAMNLLKNTSVALTISLVELTFRTREMAENTFDFFPVFSVATLIYITLSLTINFSMRWLEKYLAIPGYLGGK